MPFIIGSAIAAGGALIGADASRDAAKTQAGSANNANALTAAQFDKTQANLSPWLRSGTSANDYLSTLLGIPGYESGPRIMNGAEYSLDQIKDIFRKDQLQKLSDQGRPNDALDEQGIDRGAENVWRGLTPASKGGDGQFGMLTKPFGMEDFEASPAYKFNLEEGRKAIDKAAAARGKYYAPATLQDISKFSQGLASNEFQNAFNNYNTSIGNIYSRLQNASGAGQNAAVQTGAAGANATGQIGNNLIGAGNANAAGTVGASNAITGAGSQAYNNYVLQQILGRNQTGTYDKVPEMVPGQFSLVNPAYG